MKALDVEVRDFDQGLNRNDLQGTAMDELATEINRVARLRGSFVLRSGSTSAEYLDKYRFEGSPGLLRKIARRMIELVPRDTEVLAGLELGGIPIVTAMSLESGIPAVFVRKTAKTYGTCRAVEGGDVRGKRTVVIEDVISTGGAVLEAAKLLREEDCHLLAVVCAIWRGKGSPLVPGLDLPVSAAFVFDDLE